MTPQQMQRKITDDLGRQIIYNYPPLRIISLVPSITELLFYLGLEKNIVGVTDYCIYPENAKNKTKIGGTKNPDIKIIEKLNPDIILAEKSENAKNITLKIAENFPVFVFDVKNFDNAISMIRKTGDITGKKAEARILSEKILEKFIENFTDFENKSVIFPVWKNPYIVAGKDTFINSVLELLNLKNVFSYKEKTYPKITIEEIKANCPDFIFLGNEPYNFVKSDAREFKEICPQSRVIFIKSEMFIWYGSRLLFAADYFSELKNQILNTDKNL